MALQCEDRNVRCNDDQHREQCRAANLDDRLKNRIEPFSWTHLPLLFRQFAEHVFNDNHGAVDDDAEVHRSQRQQVRGYAQKGQAEEGAEQREWND